MTTETEKQAQKPILAAGSGKKEASTASKVIAVLLAIIFVFTAVVGVVGYDVWRVLFNAPLVKQVLTDEMLHSDLVPAILESFSENRAKERINKGESLSGIDEPDIVLLMSYLDADKWREIKDIMLTDEFVTHLISVAVDGLYGWIDSSDVWPQVVWEMSDIKTRLVGEQGEEAIMIAYEAMPECTKEEIADFTSRLAAMPPGVEVLYNLCQFPVPWHDDQVEDYKNALIDVNQNIPPQYDFSKMLSEGQATSQANPEMLKVQLRGLRQLAQLGWIIAVVLLGLIALLAVRSLRSLGQFVGIPLLISGLLVLLIGFTAQPSITNFVSSILLSNTTDFLRQEVGRSLSHLTGEIFQPMLLEGGILVFIGIVLIVLMMVKKGKRTTEKA